MPSASRSVAASQRRRWISPEPLNVAPALIGRPLAAPSRRALAIAVDLAIVALLSDVSGFWLLGGLALVALQLRSRRGGATRGPRWIIGWVGVALVLWLALQQAGEQWQAWRHPAATAAARESEAGDKPGGETPAATGDDDEPEAGDADAAAKLRRAAEAASAARAALAAVAAPSAPSTAVPAAALAAVAAAIDQLASAASMSASAAGGDAASAARLGDAERIARLEAELAEARHPKHRDWRERIGGLLDDIGLSFGWGIVYFALLPAWWGGQTVGKKLFGLQVVELTGKPMTVMRSLKRYGGYAAGMATGGLGFLQVLWDPNRQAIQDKTAHTAVIDLRAAPPAPTEPAATTAPASAISAITPNE